MSDPETSSGLSAPEEARLRRLLADARHTAPMPDDVVGRLDDVLARLAVEEPVATPSGEPRPADREHPDPVVVALDAQRRRTLRRRVAGGLLAAAALVVGGVTVPQLLGSGFGGVAEDASSGEASRPGADEGAEAPHAAADPEAVATFPALEDLPTGAAQNPSALDAYLSEESVARIEAEAWSTSSFRLPCRDAAWGAGRKLPVVFGSGSERQRGVAVVRGGSAEGAATVELFVCGRTEPVGSLEVPTR